MCTSSSPTIESSVTQPVAPAEEKQVKLNDSKTSKKLKKKKLGTRQLQVDISGGSSGSGLLIPTSAGGSS